jgi:hypothetical protein
MLQRRDSSSGRHPPAPGCDLPAGDWGVLGSFRRAALEEIAREWPETKHLSNDREGSCAMGFVPIRMDEFIKLHRKSNPGERPDEFISLLRRSVADARRGARCHCGAPIWAIGSAVVGNACFTCITGEADPSSDYEIDEVLKGGGGETLVAQGFVDDQSSKVFRSRRGHKTRKPNPKMQA